MLSKIPFEVASTRMIYNGGIHGWLYTDFHRECDNKTNPKLVIAKSRAGKIFGGFTEKTWNTA